MSEAWFFERVSCNTKDCKGEVAQHPIVYGSISESYNNFHVLVDRLVIIWGDPEMSGEIQCKKFIYLFFLTFQKQTLSFSVECLYDSQAESRRLLKE